MLSDVSFMKSNLDDCLRTLAKEFRRLNGKFSPAEITLVGGASILANYGFRDITYDMDAIINASSSMKEAINNVGDRLNLPNGWLNADFIKTKSYSPKIREFSVYYKTFSNILEVRTIAAEYLIAMKLMSGRLYKNDRSDIVGILREHEEKSASISYEQIDKAVLNLYGSWEEVPASSKEFLSAIFVDKDYETLYQQCRQKELFSKETLLAFEEKYPGVTKENNINEILEKANQKVSTKKEYKKSR